MVELMPNKAAALVSILSPDDLQTLLGGYDHDHNTMAEAAAAANISFIWPFNNYSLG